MLSVLKVCHLSPIGGHHSGFCIVHDFCTVDTIGLPSTKELMIFPKSCGCCQRQGWI